MKFLKFILSLFTELWRQVKLWQVAQAEARSTKEVEVARSEVTTKIVALKDELDALTHLEGETIAERQRILERRLESDAEISRAYGRLVDLSHNW